MFVDFLVKSGWVGLPNNKNKITFTVQKHRKLLAWMHRIVQGALLQSIRNQMMINLSGVGYFHGV